MEHTPSYQELSSRYAEGQYVPRARGRVVDPYLEEEDLPGSEHSGLIAYWHMLRRNVGTLILISFLGLAAGILLTLPQTPLFRARTVIEIQDINGDFLNSKHSNPVSESSTVDGIMTDVQTQMKIIQSEYLIDRVVDKLKREKVIDSAKKTPGRFAPIRKLLNLSEPSEVDQDYNVRQSASRSLTARQIGSTRLIEIMYTSVDPRLAARFLNTITAEYIESNMDARWKMSEHTGEWLSHQLDEMRTKLERSETALQQYAQRSGLLYTSSGVGASEKSNISEEKLREIQASLSKASADRAAAQSSYEIASTAPAETVGDVMNDAYLRELQSRLTDLQRQEAELISVYTEKHEKVKRVRSQIAPLQAEFNRERRAILARINNDYNSARRRETLLQNDYAKQTGIVTEQASKSIEYNILKRDVDSNRQLYENMLQQLKESTVASAIRASNVRIVDPAKIPRGPYAPSLTANAALGLLFGLVMGAGVVVMRERADRTLQEPGDAQFWTHLPELGVIPSAALEDSTRVYGQELSDSTFAGIDLPQRNVVGKLQRPVEMMSWWNKPSLVAEAFRTVLTSILFTGENGSSPRVLVLTSAGPGDGKTTAVSNLAVALAEIRRRVLVIDADLRRPRLHDIFQVPNDRGLSTLLREETINSWDLDNVIHETVVPGLHVLPSGPPTAAAATLLYSPNMAGLLNKFKNEYDLVLVDTPPMLQMTDARIVGRLADAVVFVARAGQTTRDAAIAAQQRFAEDRIRMIGIILNDWNPRHSHTGYYGYHKNNYVSSN